MLDPQIVLSLHDGLRFGPTSMDEQGNIQLDCGLLHAGIYRCSALFDATDYDWSRLYLPMSDYGNEGQNTGPWDFDFKRIEPLVPAWWAWVNDRRIGPAVVARPSPAQIARKQFSLVWCFEITSTQPVTLLLKAINATQGIQPIQWRLEADQQETPVPIKLVHDDACAASFASSQVQHEVWCTWQDKLTRLDCRYAKVVECGVAAAKAQAQKTSDVEMLKLLVYAWQAHDDQEAGRLACQVVAKQVSLEHWGNQCESGYGHDTDMGVASVLENLSFALHWLGDRLDQHEPSLRKRLVEKLRLQMKRFYDGILLWAGYWGGSLMQDHGHRSISRFGVTAINLLGVLDEAPRWVAFAKQRIEQVIAILPADGGIPFSSYFKIHLYMDDLLTWRDALKHATGQDIYGHPLFARVLDGVINRLDLSRRVVMTCLARGDRIHFYAGWGYFNAIAAHTHTGQGVTLTQALLDDYLNKPISQRPLATMLAMIDHADPGLAAEPLTPAAFDHRADIGQINYRTQDTQANVALRCSIPAGLPAIFELTNPCDRIIDVPLEGHFSIHVKGKNLLLTAEGGYRMRSNLGCTLLIDGKGGYEDQDYAMGVPGVSYRGQHIEIARFDASTQQAFIRMNLAPAYPREAGLLRYVREFQLSPTGLVFRDLLISSLAHEYAWQFHSYASAQITSSEPEHWRISQEDAALTLQGRCLETSLQSKLQPTQVVWGYANEHNSQPFQHVRFETSVSTKCLSAEFAIRWD